MQELSKRYHLGIRVDQVQLKNVNPPSQVQASFNEVNKAQQDRENAISVANGDYNKAVPKAKGEADQTIRGAEGIASSASMRPRVTSRLLAPCFNNMSRRPRSPALDFTSRRMSEILPQTGQKIIVDESLRQLLPILSLSTKPREGRQ
jgi:membrane protease subunit HflK